ncbi:MAG: asparagine synthase (glutamine-hydrolyzing) [Terriglobia bacterium]
MCGIVGACRPGDPNLRGALRAALAALRHRGPDDDGIELLFAGDAPNALGLGVRRLAILDTSAAGHQPMHDPATGNWIVHNGEVYNFRELRRELEAVGHCFRSQSDTEVLLQSYAAWGLECVTRWRGMFATAIWDAPRRRLVLVRDRLGVKPLYFHQEGSRFAFASEVRALVKGGWVAPCLNLTALDSFLSFGAVQEPLTIIAGVRALPPGHLLVWEGGRLQISSYWDPFAGKAARGSTAARLPELLGEAARLRLVSDVPVGVFLSGGIDSSSVVALLSGPSPGELRTFSVVFPEDESDEAACAQRVAGEFRTAHHELALDEAELLRQLPGALAAMDQPTADGINTYLVSGAVRQAGLKVALSGLGGDELFGGYTTFRRAPRLARLESVCARLPRLGRHALARLVGALPRATDGHRKLRALLHGGGAAFPDPVFLLRALFLPDQVAELLTPDAILGLDYSEYAARLQPLLAQARVLDPFTRVSWLELRHYLLNTLLRDTDQMSMAHSLEVRVPFLDHRLVEAVLALPGTAKANGRVPKPLLVGSLPRALPAEIVRRPKRGFTLPFERWLRGQLRAEVEARLLQPSAPLAGVLRPEAIAEVWRSFLARRHSWSRPWTLYVLLRWAEGFAGRR